MGPMLLRMLQNLKNRLLEEHGQDLVEYALIVAIVSFAAVAAEQNVATSIEGGYMQLAAAFTATV